MAGAREIDDNGYLTVKSCPVSSYGIFDYSAQQIGITEGDPRRIVKVFRPEETLTDPEFLASFQTIPLIIDHTNLSADDDAEKEGLTTPEDKGLEGVMTNVVYEKPWVRGDIKVFTRRGRQVLKKISDLSLGFSADFILKPGVYNGEPYEAIQVNMRGNHIALVGEGRVPGARVLDGLCFDHLSFEVVPSDKESTMSKRNRMRAGDSSAIQTLLSLIPALQQFLQQEAQEPEHQEGAAGGAEGGATATAQPEAVSSNEGGEDNAGSGESAEQGGEQKPALGDNEIRDLLAQAKSCIANIEASLGNGAVGDEGEQGGETQSAVQDSEGGEKPAGVGDAVEGLQEAGGEGSYTNNESQPGHNGKASPGPAQGSNAMAGDASLGRFYADLATKDSLYNRLSKVVGAFDHSRMDSAALAVYGARKLGLKCGDAAALSTVTAYLDGVESERKKTATAVQNARKTSQTVGDASGTGLSAELSAYLQKGAE